MSIISIGGIIGFVVIVLIALFFILGDRKEDE